MTEQIQNTSNNNSNCPYLYRLHVFVKVFIQHAAMRLDDIYIILVDVSNTIWIIFDHEIFLTIP